MSTTGNNLFRRSERFADLPIRWIPSTIIQIPQRIILHQKLPHPAINNMDPIVINGEPGGETDFAVSGVSQYDKDLLIAPLSS